MELLGHMRTLSKLFEELPNCFPKWLHHFTIQSAMYEGSSLSTSSPTLVIVCLFHSINPSEYKLVSCGFDLHFPND